MTPYPKIELHVHLEGTVRAHTLLEIAKRNDYALPADTVEGLQELYRFTDFRHFIDVWILTTNALPHCRAETSSPVSAARLAGLPDERGLTEDCAWPKGRPVVADQTQDDHPEAPANGNVKISPTSEDEQTRSDRDLTLSDADQTGSDRDQTTADSDRPRPKPIRQPVIASSPQAATRRAERGE